MTALGRPTIPRQGGPLRAWAGRTLVRLAEGARRLGERWSAGETAGGHPATQAPAGAGKVWLVGFGPGDARFVTHEAERVLESADLILYDDLVDARALEVYPGEKRYVGKRCGRAGTSQQSINSLISRAALRGLRVARVKGGDPAIFSRAGEELAHLRDLGVEVEIIPGVSAAFAAAACLGVPLTLRGVARSVELRTGHAAPGESPGRPTVVYYMAATRLVEVAQELEREGWPETTPVGLVEQASRANQRCHITTLALLPTLVTEAPATLIVGEVVRLSDVVNPAAERKLAS